VVAWLALRLGYVVADVLAVAAFRSLSELAAAVETSGDGLSFSTVSAVPVGQMAVGRMISHIQDVVAGVEV